MHSHVCLDSVVEFWEIKSDCLFVNGSWLRLRTKAPQPFHSLSREQTDGDSPDPNKQSQRRQLRSWNRVLAFIITFIFETKPKDTFHLFCRHIGSLRTV